MADVFTETPLIKKVLGLEEILDNDDPTKPRIFLIKTNTETGPLTLKVSEVAAVELAANLESHPIIRGSR